MRTLLRNSGIHRLLGGLLLAQLIGVAVYAQPTLVSSSPASGAMNVALDSKIIFTFSTAMQVPADYSTAVTWIDGLSLLVPGNFSYAWSAGNSVLTATYSANLPASDSVTWFLNTSDFLDTMGNELIGVPFGFFTTTSGGGGTTNNCLANGTNASVTSFSLFKEAMYVQNSAGPSTPDNSSDAAFSFIASVSLATNRTATSVTLAVPGGSPQPMTSFFGSPYLLFESTNDLAILNTDFPAGSYAFNVTGSLNQSVSANLPATTLPNAPHLSNYTAAQSINAGLPFTLTWDPFIGGTPTLAIGVEVRDSLNRVVFEITNSAGCPSLLPGTDKSVVIPANTLSSNLDYTLTLMFNNQVSVSSNASPPSVTLVYGQSTTTMTISTKPGGVVPPPSMVLTNVALLPSGAIQFQFPTAPGTAYTVEYASEFDSPTTWTTLVTTNAAGASVQITDSPPAVPGTRYYRTKHN